MHSTRPQPRPRRALSPNFCRGSAAASGSCVSRSWTSGPLTTPALAGKPAGGETNAP